MAPDELKEFLEGRPEETRQQEAIWIASRIAGRVMPYAIKEGPGSLPFGLTALPVLRCLAISRLASLVAAGEVREVIPAATTVIVPAINFSKIRHGIVDVVGKRVVPTRPLVLRNTAINLANAALASAKGPDTKSSITHTTSAAAIAGETSSLTADTAALESGAWKTEPLPLWPDTESSEAIQLWEQMRPKLPRPGAGYGPDTARGEPIDDWGFWIDWYESWLEGKPFDLELQKKVARISGEDWQHEDNPGHVNEIISKMYLRFQLSQWIEFVEQELVATPQASASVSLRGHNNPPEILPSVEQQEVLQALVRARTELASDVPDVEVLTDASEEIEHWARRALKYLGAKADLFVTEASKELGREGVKWLVRGGSVLIVAKLLNIAEILRAFAGL